MRVEGLACLAAGLAMLVFLCGPIALIISIVALNKINLLLADKRAQVKSQAVLSEEQKLSTTEPQIPIQNIPVITEEQIPSSVRVSEIAIPAILQPPVIDSEQTKKDGSTEQFSFELFIGTRGLAIAGSIAMLVGVIIGLKYLYDMKMITPLGRTLIVAGAGIASLIIGQLTRKRGYGFAATALAALGFAMLYAADFAAFGFYHIINTNLAFGLAIADNCGRDTVLY